MERIIFYVLPLFVLLVVYLAFKLFKNRSLYLAAAAENERLQAEIDAQQKEIFLWSRKGEEFVPASDEDVARFKLPYPIIHRELMELRPKFTVRRLYGNWILHFPVRLFLLKPLIMTKKTVIRKIGCIIMR